jgi:L-glutamine-phosphate cytidylyltransferase
MPTTNAIILCAGEGKRLLPYTLEKPKPLMEVNGTTILENALNGFAEHGVKNVRIVIGHLAQTIQKTFGTTYRGMNLTYFLNEKYASTNSMYSLFLGLENLHKSIWILEGDVFFEKKILNQHNDKPLSWFCDGSQRNLDGAYLKEDSGHRAISLEIIRNTADIQKHHFKSIGLLHCSKEAVSKITGWLDKGIKALQSNLYYDLIFAEHFKEIHVHITDIQGFKWFEIDTVSDLEKAKQIFQ